MKKIDNDGLLLCEIQAKAFELSCEAQNTSSEIFIRRFMNSETAKRLDNMTLLQSNMQAADLLVLIDEEYGSSDYGSVKYSLNELYWIGYIYRYWHYYSGEDSAKILRQAPVETMKRNFMIFHTMDPVLAIEDLKEIHNQKN